MKPSPVLFVLLSVALLFSSCKCKEKCDSIDYQFNLVFQGFSSAEVSPLVVKHYVRGTGFAVFRDNTVLSTAGQFIDGSGLVEPLFAFYGNDSTDYLFSLPGGMLTYRLTSLTFENSGCVACSKTFTIHELKNCEVNGMAWAVTAQSNITITK